MRMIRYRGIKIDRERRRLEHAGRAIDLGPRRFALACALLLAGRKNKREIFDLIYGDDEDGGPLCGVKTLDAMIHQIRKRLAVIGVMVRFERHLNCHRFWAEPA